MNGTFLGRLRLTRTSVGVALGLAIAFSLIGWGMQRQGALTGTVIGREDTSRTPSNCAQVEERDLPPLTASFDGLRACWYARAQVDFGPRNPGSPGHAAAREYLLAELGKYMDWITAQDFTFQDRTGSYNMTNVIGAVGLDRQTQVLLAAHWDTRPRAERDPDPARRGEPILGANDGASGVAVLLELARVFRERPPQVGVIFALFDGEDYGTGPQDMFLGSQHYARNIIPIRPTYGMLLDMVGDTNLSIPMEGNSQLRAAPIVQKVWSVARALGRSEFSDQMGPFIFDDHIPLLDAGIPTIDIIDFAYPDFSHAYWHTTQDTLDKISPTSLAAVGEVVAAVLYAER